MIDVRDREPGGRATTVVGWAIIGLSAVLHLVALGARPLAHDEAIDAWFSWQARNFGVVRYDPVYHGPLRFYLEGIALRFGGTGPGWARLVAASAGIAITAVLVRSVRTLGRIGAPVAALLFTISPTALTVTRTGREDSLTALVSLGLLLLVAAALREPRPRQLIGCGVLLAASFGLKETTFLFGAVALAFFVVAALIAWRRPSGESRAAVRQLVALGRIPWMWTAIAFVMVFIVIFTSAFRYSEGFTSGLLDGVRYWWGQQPVGRGGQPWWFYVAIYASYEWLIVAFAVVGLVVAVRRRSLVGAWFAAMAAGQVVAYAWAGEKFAWLAIHSLVPMVLLAGIGAEALVRRLRAFNGGRARVRVAVGASALAALLTLVIAVPPAITDGADPSELLVAVQTSTDVPPLAARLQHEAHQGRLERVLVDSSGGGAWPWAWYLIDVPDVDFGEIDPNDLPEGYDAIILLAAEQPPAVPDGYRLERFSLRRWWVPDYEHVTVGDAFRWLFTREVWSPTASQDQYLLLRNDA